MKDPFSFSSKAWYAFWVFFAFSWAIPWVAVGIFLLIPIVSIPIGMLAIGIGCAPFGYIEKKRVATITSWYLRDRTYAEEYEEEVPWEI